MKRDQPSPLAVGRPVHPKLSSERWRTKGAWIWDRGVPGWRIRTRRRAHTRCPCRPCMASGWFDWVDTTNKVCTDRQASRPAPCSDRSGMAGRTHPASHTARRRQRRASVRTSCAVGVQLTVCVRPCSCGNCALNRYRRLRETSRQC